MKKSSSCSEKKLGVTNTSSLTWEYLLGYTRNREYDYWISAKHKEKDVLKDDLHNMRNIKLEIEYNADRCDLKIDSVESPDVEIWTDPESKCLIAVLVSNASVRFQSHLVPKWTKMNRNEEVELFCHKKLFNELIEKQDIDFDPSESFLEFGKESGKKVTVTIGSRAAGGLFTSIVQDPYSGLYPTLNNLNCAII